MSSKKKKKYSEYSVEQLRKYLNNDIPTDAKEMRWNIKMQQVYNLGVVNLLMEIMQNLYSETEPNSEQRKAIDLSMQYLDVFDFLERIKLQNNKW